MIAPGKTPPVLWLTLCALAICAWPFALRAQTTVPMATSGGVNYIACKVNGLPLPFIIDTGASDVTISSNQAQLMLQNGYLNKSDFLGEQSYQIANGETMKGKTLIFRQLEIGDIVLHNVWGSVSYSSKAPLLLGQSALRQLGSVSFNYAGKTVTFGGKPSTYTSVVVVKAAPPRAVSQPVHTALRALSRPEIAMIFVKGGSFTMGCMPERDGKCDDDEKPAHQVTVSDFYIGKYEVTQAEWQAVMGNNPSYFQGDNRPVEQVSWNDVQEFISRLNTMTRKNYRLPTEAEWEYAARGGAESREYRYSGGNNADAVAWSYENSGVRNLHDNAWSQDAADQNSNQTHPVGTKAANELGIHDMGGNVWEWCQDYYAGNYYQTNPASDPPGPDRGVYRAIRGGGWLGSAGICRSANRDYWRELDERRDLGFRLALHRDAIDGAANRQLEGKFDE